jgi:hypothetical protein
MFPFTATGRKTFSWAAAFAGSTFKRGNPGFANIPIMQTTKNMKIWLAWEFFESLLLSIFLIRVFVCLIKEF